MRHQKRKKTLDRGRDARRALLSTLAGSLVEHGRIRTTLAKAKVVKPLVEKGITLAKQPTLAHRRQLRQTYSLPQTQQLMNEIGPRYQTRPGGYLRIIKLPPRRGDGAAMAIIELV